MLLELEASTGTTPQALLDAPNLIGVSKEVSKAYDVLASRRTVGFAPNPIPLTEIIAYVNGFGLPNIDLQTFVQLIGVMDMAYLELVHGDNKSSSKRKHPTSGRGV